jgi:tRNA threonylcarbamoyladenosine biosynthesis protein TsaE
MKQDPQSLSPIRVADEAQMLNLAQSLAPYCQANMLIFLTGQLGVGKTTFTRGLLRALGYSGTVKSPTYTIVEPYTQLHLPVYHFDLYRVQDSQELELLGVRDYLADQALCVVEWPEYGSDILPTPDVTCYIEAVGQGRHVQISAQTARGRLCLQLWREACSK